MIIKQTLNRGHEDKGVADILRMLPDPEVQDAFSTVLDVIRNNIIYKKFFVIEVDTVAKKAEVVEVV